MGMEGGSAMEGGNARRTCDVCGRERARWYCGADEAYLCDRCDGSVHSANAVARRHERVRCGGTKADNRGLEMKGNDFSFFFGAAARRRPRTSRPHPQRAKSKVKPEAEVEIHAAAPVPENAGDSTSEDFNDEELLPQVPIFLPALADDCGLPGLRISDVGDAVKVKEHSKDSNCEPVVVPDSVLHQFLNSEMDLFPLDMEMDMDMDMDMESIIGQGLVDDVLGFHSNDNHNHTSERELEEFATSVKIEEDRSDGLSNNNDDAASKVKVEEHEAMAEQSWDTIEINIDYEDEDQEAACTTAEAYQTRTLDLAEYRGDFKIELDLGSIPGAAEKRISLKLNYEDVLSAWSDRGSLWASYHDCTSDLGCNGFEAGLVPDLSLNGAQVGPMPGMINGGVEEGSCRHGGREARVLRYREKRRTRLFSKKIRYEVRKLNAEKRPRMKGRFVKRTSGMSSD